MIIVVYFQKHNRYSLVTFTQSRETTSMARLMTLATAIFLIVKPTLESPLFSEKTFVPRKATLETGILRRHCVAAAPDVSKEDVSESPKINNKHISLMK